MVLKAHENGLLTVFAPDLIDKGVVVLQYAEETVFFISNDLDQVIKFKFLLYMFELTSSLTINFLKMNC